MQTESNTLVQLEFLLGPTIKDQSQVEPTPIQPPQEKPPWQEVFPELPPSEVVIFPKGTTIYRVEGRTWGSISGGDRGKVVVALELTDLVKSQPRVHPKFVTLVSTALFIEGRGDHEQLGANRIQFRASRADGLRGRAKREAWMLWRQEMLGRGCTWNNLRDAALLKIQKTSQNRNS